MLLPSESFLIGSGRNYAHLLELLRYCFHLGNALGSTHLGKVQSQGNALRRVRVSMLEELS